MYKTIISLTNIGDKKGLYLLNQQMDVTGLYVIKNSSWLPIYARLIYFYSLFLLKGVITSS
jgi:hypothetical protein